MFIVINFIYRVDDIAITASLNICDHYDMYS